MLPCAVYCVRILVRACTLRVACMYPQVDVHQGFAAMRASACLRLYAPFFASLQHMAHIFLYVHIPAHIPIRIPIRAAVCYLP